MLLIRNAKVFDAVHETPYQADILIDGGKIADIGEALSAPEDCEVFDAAGLNAYPGFVEAHGHTGLDGYGIGYEGADYNEYNDILSPQLRAIDAIQPFDFALKEAARAGVTCLCVGPGSANVLGGTFAAIKPVGKRVDDMCIKEEVAMKCAFGENPKRCYREKGDSTRMSTAAKLREMLFKAREYMQKLENAGEDISKRPAFDLKLHALIPVLKGEMPLKAHAHQADDLFTAIRIAKEFGVRLTLEHVTEGHLVAEELVKEGYPVAVGPTLGHASKFELRNKSWTTPGALNRAGLNVSIITDSPVIPQKYLAMCAGLAVKSGMDAFEALKAITINSAKHIGLENRVGSLEKGKDADIVLTDGCPFEISTNVVKVYIDGKEVE
ncbi:MAG: amidohydrolase [Christensenellales bacterium]|jgi:imidazolonepropionase-like amidohydrolase